MSGVFTPYPIETLVILGMGQSSQSWAGLMAEQPGFDAQVWTINSGMRAFRHDVVFDMHTEEYIEQQEDTKRERIAERRGWMKIHNKPIVMPKALDDYPTSMTYPLKLVMDTLKTDYFTNGMAYMLALACLCEVKMIYMIGADYMVAKPDGRVFVEDGRACLEYWLGRLVERGCQVRVTDKSALLAANVRGNRMIYGYHNPVVTYTNDEGNQVLQYPDFTQQAQGPAGYVYPDGSPVRGESH
jgi:hypothetical protein